MAEAAEQTTLRRLNLNKIFLKCSELKEHVKGVETFQVAFIQASAGKKRTLSSSLYWLFQTLIQFMQVKKTIYF